MAIVWTEQLDLFAAAGPDTRPVVIDGAPFRHRGRQLLHCDPACYRGDGVTGDR